MMPTDLPPKRFPKGLPTPRSPDFQTWPWGLTVTCPIKPVVKLQLQLLGQLDVAVALYDKLTLVFAINVPWCRWALHPGLPGSSWVSASLQQGVASSGGFKPAGAFKPSETWGFGFNAMPGAKPVAGVTGAYAVQSTMTISQDYAAGAYFVSKPLWLAPTSAGLLPLLQGPTAAVDVTAEYLTPGGSAYGKLLAKPCGLSSQGQPQCNFLKAEDAFLAGLTHGLRVIRCGKLASSVLPYGSRNPGAPIDVYTLQNVAVDLLSVVC